MLFELGENNYIESPFNYTGSKFRLLDQIYPYFPKEDVTFVDLFVGGGSVFINSLYNKIIANDIITPLMSFYRELQDMPLDFILEKINSLKIDKTDQAEYTLKRENFNLGGAKEPYLFFALLCSCTNNMIRFNKEFKFNQTFGKRTFNKNTQEKMTLFYNKLKTKDVLFLNKPYYEVPIPTDSFVYLDPPYLITEAGYNAFWSKENEKNLYSFIDSLNDRGIKFMLSNVAKHKGVVNPHLDKLNKYKIINLNLDYNKVSRSGESNSEEIMVVNY